MEQLSKSKNPFWIQSATLHVGSHFKSIGWGVDPVSEPSDKVASMPDPYLTRNLEHESFSLGLITIGFGSYPLAREGLAEKL